MTEVRGGTILIVEDDPGVATLERQRLEPAGYTVSSASPDNALRLLVQREVDLILLDCRLPGDGLTFLDRLRQAGHDVPVILVAGSSDEATVIRALRAGVRDFVTRSPEYLDYLPEAVGRVLAQVRTERRLAESEARLAALIDTARDAILIVESNQRISLFNHAAEVMFRCSAADAIGQPISRFIPREFEAEPHGPGQNLGSVTHRVRFGKRGLRPGGEEFPLEASVARARIRGRTFHTIVIRDITERVRAEEALRTSEARYRKLVETAGAAILSLGADGTIREWNHEAERLFGWRRDEMLGRDYFERCLPAETRLRVRADTLEVLGGKPIKEHETPVLTRDGGRRVVLWNLTLGAGEGGLAAEIIAIGVDVTEQRRLEEQYRQAQKMEAIGRLAGGVAHDFNNLLTVINGYSEVLLAQAGRGEKIHEPLEEIHKAGERAASLTRQLLAFSRKSILQPRVLDLNVLISDTQRMLRRLIGEDVQIVTSLAADLAPVKVDPGQIEQVLMNLCINARDAMPGGGRLTIETSNSSPNGGDDWVLLAVTDTGCGMSEVVKARIFEPFFTTKEQGKGTGLGLSTVYGIVQQSGGLIKVQSEEGRGTTFRIFLPRSQEGDETGLGLATGLEAPRGTETILLAEDDEGVRGLAAIALRAQGYTVLEAKDGQEGLDLWQRHQGGIDLLVTDVVMPRMGGRQLADLMTGSCPGLRVLYLSGYTDDAVLRQGLTGALQLVGSMQAGQASPGTAGRAFLAKPFTATALVRKVREVLDQPAPRAAPA
jgi:PAS domain S-box-containing protein